MEERVKKKKKKARRRIIYTKNRSEHQEVSLIYQYCNSEI